MKGRGKINKEKDEGMCSVMEITPMITGKLLPCIVKTRHSLFRIVCFYL